MKPYNIVCGKGCLSTLKHYMLLIHNIVDQIVNHNYLTAPSTLKLSMRSKNTKRSNPPVETYKWCDKLPMGEKYLAGLIMGCDQVVGMLGNSEKFRDTNP